MTDDLDEWVERARAGDRRALDSVLAAVQKDVYNLALRFLWHPEDAEDATQEILVRVAAGLGGFRGESRFRTWVYRVAANTLSTLRRRRMELAAFSFDELGADLERGLSDAVPPFAGVDEALLLEEVKVGCTLAMLLCLERDERLAYILGEILELDHREAAAVVETTPAAFRKRLSRARERIVAFVRARCGLAHPENPCRCRRRVRAAVALGRVDPYRLRFATSAAEARRFPRVLRTIRRLEDTRRAAALFRSHAPLAPPEGLVRWLRDRIDGAVDEDGVADTDEDTP